MEISNFFFYTISTSSHFLSTSLVSVPVRPNFFLNCCFMKLVTLFYISFQIDLFFQIESCTFNQICNIFFKTISVFHFKVFFSVIAYAFQIFLPQPHVSSRQNILLFLYFSLLLESLFLFSTLIQFHLLKSRNRSWIWAPIRYCHCFPLPTFVSILFQTSLP